MLVREIKAYIHRSRIADVVDALYNEGFRNLAVIDVEGLLNALDDQEQRYSVEIGRKVVTEVKLELYCTDERLTERAVSLIQKHAKTGRPSAGWIYISEIRSAFEIGI